MDLRRKGAITIYISEDQSEFLRIGQQAVVRDLMQRRDLMKAAGFTVPTPVTDGSYGSLYYYAEKSLGSAHFGEIFAREVKEFGLQDSLTAFKDIDFIK